MISDPDTAARLDTVETALESAVADRARVAEALTKLDPERAARELKDALRRAQTSPGGPDDDHIATMRRRHETIHALRDRLEQIDRQIEKTLVDVEALAARSVGLAASPTTDSALGGDLDRLHADIAAIEAAHDEIRRL